jgi:alpha-N-arabinofuranosidase
VEYCNAPTGLYYSDLRAKNGHPQPYKVRYWGLGNEMDGEWQMGHKDAVEYSKFALEAAKLMKWSDDSIKIIAAGSSNYTQNWAEWNRTVLNTLKEHMDYISLHHYSGNRNGDHLQFMAITTQVENIIRITDGIINEVRSKYKIKKPIYIAFDEYNVWYRAWTDQKLEERYNLQDALVVAGYLNTFLRQAHIVKMANMAQLVNVIAPMMVTGDKLWYQTIFYPLQLFARNCHGQSVETFVDCDRYDDQAKGQVVLNVVNRHPDKAIDAQVLNQFGKWDKKGVVSEVNSGSLTDQNSEREQKVKTVLKEVNTTGDGFNYTFPAHSFTQIRLKLLR